MGAASVSADVGWGTHVGLGAWQTLNSRLLDAVASGLVCSPTGGLLDIIADSEASSLGWARDAVPNLPLSSKRMPRRHADALPALFVPALRGRSA